MTSKDERCLRVGGAGSRRLTTSVGARGNRSEPRRCALLWQIGRAQANNGLCPIALLLRLPLLAGDREKLERLVRSPSSAAGLAPRARIVLLAADGMSNTAIAEVVGASRPTVIGWRERYAERGIAGLVDLPRAGRPRTIDHAAIVRATSTPPPAKLGISHWSTRLLARQLGISDATVAQGVACYGIQPWRSRSFRFSTDPQLEAKVVDVVGL